jgi:hypothetical protein
MNNKMEASSLKAGQMGGSNATLKTSSKLNPNVGNLKSGVTNLKGSKMAGGATRIGGLTFNKNKNANKSKMKTTTSDKDNDIVWHGSKIANPKK